MSLDQKYTRGIAFIMEGATEKVFYKSFLTWIAQNYHCSFEKGNNTDSGDIYYEWDNHSEKILIKINVVGTVTQMPHSANWFVNRCSKKHKIPWTVFLCYDTDSPNNDITKFYLDDWKLLRNDIKKARTNEIIDLAASAEIEDIMLYDLAGICNYLDTDVPDRIPGRTGKAKMKALYRSCGNTYHEGDRAEDMIKTLDFQKIMDSSPLNLKKLVEMLSQ